MLRRIFFGTLFLVMLLMGVLLAILPTPDPKIEPFDSGLSSKDKTTLQSKNSFVIKNVRLFDGHTVSEQMQLIVRDGIVTDMGKELDLPDDMPVIDGTNRTVLPGLIDAHTHNYGNALVSSLRFGVTTTLDMFTDVALFTEARKQRDSLAITQQTDIFSAGMMATAPKGHGTQYGVPIEPISTIEQVPGWVAKRVAEGSDYIKLVYIPGQNRIASLNRATAAEIIRVAHEHNLLAVVHVSTLQAASDMLDDGADGLVHLFADQKVTDEFITKALKNNLFIVPTLSVIASVDGHTFGAEITADKNMVAYLDSQQYSSLNSTFNHHVSGFDFDLALQNTKLLHAAGVTLLAGSDAPNPGTAFGASLHQEMQLLVQGGLSAVEALQAASSIPAVAFNLPDRGVITPGVRADLLIVNGNPAADITATRDIAFVFKNGYLIDRSLSPAAQAPALEISLISSFDTDLSAGGGLMWNATDDSITGGTSSAKLTHRIDDASSAQGVLHVSAQVTTGFAYPWAGAYLSVQSTRTPAFNIENKRTLSFRARGTAGTYQVMMFHAGASGAPSSQSFVMTPEWQTQTFDIDKFPGFSPLEFTALAIVAGPTPGEFEYQLDHVTLAP